MPCTRVGLYYLDQCVQKTCCRRGPTTSLRSPQLRVALGGDPELLGPPMEQLEAGDGEVLVQLVLKI